ncbi:hypothetical protein TNCV_1368651 [Trichonephila clavipes]|nr:hypothetical protein TNCV_1368651 [Trichonephila clavipes]
MVLKANDRRTSCPCHDEFRGPRSDYVRQSLKEIVSLNRKRLGGQIKESLVIWTIRRCWQEWVDSGRFRCHDGSCRPKATEDQEDRLTVRSAVTALDSSLSTIRLPITPIHTVEPDYSGAWLDQVGIMLTGYVQCLSTNPTFSCVLKSSKTFLSETWLGNESDISISNFNSIVKYKRPNTRAGAVAIYQNFSDAVNITPSMECSVSQSDIYGTIRSSVGNLCLAEYVIDNGQ